MLDTEVSLNSQDNVSCNSSQITLPPPILPHLDGITSSPPYPPQVTFGSLTWSTQVSTTGDLTLHNTSASLQVCMFVFVSLHVSMLTLRCLCSLLVYLFSFVFFVCVVVVVCVLLHCAYLFRWLMVVHSHLQHVYICIGRHI